MPPDTWQAASARHRFSELLDAAANGRPQFVRRRDGREVVVVSREYFDRSQPDLKSVLLSHRFGEPGDAVDKLLEDARAVIGGSALPRSGYDGEPDLGDAGHQHPE